MITNITAVVATGLENRTDEVMPRTKLSHVIAVKLYKHEAEIVTDKVKTTFIKFIRCNK